MTEGCADNLLLREFVRGGSEAAFAELVRRHVDLVYSVARRSLGGDAHLAEDVTQGAFSELARNARKLQSHPSVAGWLYTTTRFRASRVRREADRRSEREAKFKMQIETEEQTHWSDVEEVVDEALHELPERDREVVLLRYFQNQPFSAVAEVIGGTENAARMRVERALGKLRAALERRGVRCSSAVLGGLIMAHGVSTAPVTLAATIGATVGATLGATAWVNGISVLSIPKMATFISMNATQLKIGMVTIALVGTSTGWLMTERKADLLAAELSRVRTNATNSTYGGEWNAGDDNAIREELTRLRAQQSEVMRLRADVTELRRQARENPAAKNSKDAVERTGPAGEDQHSEEEQVHVAMAKMQAANAWGVAFYKYAAEHGGKIPESFADAAAFLPPEADAGNSEEFELVYRGSFSELHEPAKTIIMREKEPSYTTTDGSAQRTYLFADGHAEVYRARDGNFEPWERERLSVFSEPGEELLASEKK